jgi:hypothetical protein
MKGLRGETPGGEARHFWEERKSGSRLSATVHSDIIEGVERPHIKLSGDIEGSYVVEETRGDGRLVISPDTSAKAIMERLGHEPATLAEFEAEYGAVKPPDGEG